MSKAIRDALEEFCMDIESTGGLVKGNHGPLAPAADPDWSDLGDTYIKACKALKRKPQINR